MRGEEPAHDQFPEDHLPPDFVSASDRAAANVTVKDLDTLGEEMRKKKEEIDAAEVVVKNLKNEFSRMKAKVVNHLTQLKREDYDSPAGKMKIKNVWSVRMPADDLKKEELWNWMKEQGIFGRYATVNSKALNALFKTMKEEVEKTQGDEAAAFFTLPGLDAPTLFQDCDFKLKKQSSKKEEESGEVDEE